jgi:predicted ATPase
MNLQSPKGLMLHGEVGTGKSMLIDLFADCLPNRKKRRWHFNTFMLDTFSRLETLRRSRVGDSAGTFQDENSLLWLARDLIQTSPILFLDEFQLPDRAASKILSNLMTSFFQLGGVLIATSNRMPEELAKAAGMEFARPISGFSKLGWSLGLGGATRRDDGPGQKGEFAQFLEVLRARCEVWEMESKKDYRRISDESDRTTILQSQPMSSGKAPNPAFLKTPSTTTNLSLVAEGSTVEDPESTPLPRNYLIHLSDTTDEFSAMIFSQNFSSAISTATGQSGPINWQSSTITVYGRKIPIPRQCNGVADFTFDELCSSALGPADYITLASTYHTIVLKDIPVLSFLQKNEARRLITLLDALYEARCRLLITAAAGPDDILFPDPPLNSRSTGTDDETDLVDDAVYPETYSEIHQDLTSPFRPNVSSYSPSLSADALEDDPPNRLRRPDSSYTDERRLTAEGAKAPDFSNIGGLTGEDERFAVARAKSRIWEMCSARWWMRGQASLEEGNKSNGDVDVQGWWRPLPKESRHWERTTSSTTTASPDPNLKPTLLSREPIVPSLDSDTRNKDSEVKGLDDGRPLMENDKEIFAHGSSPFRTSSDPPPKINWTHVWGTTKWGKKAGPWGKGVEGLDERKKETHEKKERKGDSE